MSLITRTQLTGRVHSVETCGTVDGPGIRYIVFFQGCPLRCRYCHNPDTWNPKGEYARGMTIDELMADILKYQSFMRFSGGGVTASGGEPLMQPEFLAELFQQLKSEGIATALDTSGYADIETAAPVLDHTDLVLLDIKSGDPGTFRKVTGRDMAPVLSFAKYLDRKRIPAWIRFVLVPGLTDDLQEIKALAEFVSAMGNVERVEVLPFHKMGEYKWEELGVGYKLKDTPTPEKAQVNGVKDIFKSYGLAVN